MAGAVRVEEGVAGMTRVKLSHANGRREAAAAPAKRLQCLLDAAPCPQPLCSVAGVYLHGANVTSWQISNGSEVLYVRPDTPLDGVKPIRRVRVATRAHRGRRCAVTQSGALVTCVARSSRRSGGIPLCFPQFGPGGDTPGGIPGQAPMQQHGFARNMDWDICATARAPCLRMPSYSRTRQPDAHMLRPLAQGLTQLREPYVRLRLRDTPYSRAMWDHAFELEYEVVLGARDLGLTLMVRNTGGAQFAFTAALHSYLGVQDVREEGVQLLVRSHRAAPVLPPALDTPC